MQTILIESQYVGSISYWKELLKADSIVIEQYEHYVKRSYRNRCHVLGANGLLRLSIPLESGKHQHAAMKDVRISNNEKWQKLHWESLQSCYRRSPFFEYYEDQFAKLYELRFDFLLDFNFEIQQALFVILKINKEISLTKNYQKDTSANIVDLRNKSLPNRYNVYPDYLQVFNDRLAFVSDLSLFDLIFNLGNQSIYYLDKL
jgi:hypothetical protein